MGMLQGTKGNSLVSPECDLAEGSSQGAGFELKIVCPPGWEGPWLICTAMGWEPSEGGYPPTIGSNLEEPSSRFISPERSI